MRDVAADLAMFETLLTSRLMLRRLVAADAGAILRYRNDPAVARYQSWAPATGEEIRAFIAALEGREPVVAGAWFQIGVTLRATGALVGDCGVHARADDRRQVELGITLAPAAQGRGLAAEALRAILEYLFTRTGTHRVYASVDPRNQPCVRLLKHVGLRQEAHLIESLWLKGEWVDDMIFAILKREWTETNAPEPGR